MADDKRQLILDLLARARTKQGTDEAARDLDKFGDAAEDADKKTEGLGKTSEETSKKTDKLGHNLGETKKRVTDLDKEIELVSKELSSLAASFADTSDASERMDISKGIRKTETELRRLTKNRNILKDLLPDPEPETKSWLGKLGDTLSSGVSSLGETIASNKYLVAGVAAGVATLAPLISGLISAAVVGGVGLGGIVGGIALAAKGDAQIKTYASSIGKTFVGKIQESAKDAFSGPVLESLSKLEDASNRAAGGIGKIFQSVAPYVAPLTDDLIRAGEALGKSFVNAASKSGPVIESVGRLAEGLGEHLAKFVDLMADHADEAADAVDALNTIVGVTIDVVGAVVDNILLFAGAVNDLDDAIDRGRGWLEDHVSWLDLTADGYKKGSEAAELYRQGVIGVSGSANDYDHYLQGAVKTTGELRIAHVGAAGAADAQKKAEQELTDQLRAQTDPAFGLLRAIDGVKEAHKNAADASKKYGDKSSEAREATRKLAEAAINLREAAGKAGGSLDGSLSPALRNTLKAAGLTKSEIAKVEKELKDAKKAAEAYAGNYKATVTTTFVSAYSNKSVYGKQGNSRLPNEQRAAGGPVVRGVPYLVGENGPEIVVPDAGGRVLNASGSRGLMVQAGQRGTQGTMGAMTSSSPTRATVVVAGGADQGVATLINYLIRTDKIQISVESAA